MDMVKTLTSRIHSFPSLPAVVSKVLDVIASENSTMGDLTDVIKLDPPFSTDILRLANSAFFGRLMEVSTLKQAVSVLGFNEIRNLVLSKAVFNNFKNLTKSSQFDIRKFWEHSFLCGLAGQIIASDLKEDSGECFMAGLIHDIGKLIIYLELPEEFLKIVEAAGNSPFNVFQEEEKMLGVTHAHLGMMLLKKWMFPENLVSAVGFHHHPQEKESSSVFPIIIHAADLLVHYTEISDDEGANFDFLNNVFYPELMSLFKAQGIDWNSEVLEKYVEELKIRKEAAEESINLLLS